MKGNTNKADLRNVLKKLEGLSHCKHGVFNEDTLQKFLDSTTTKLEPLPKPRNASEAKQNYLKLHGIAEQGYDKLRSIAIQDWINLAESKNELIEVFIYSPTDKYKKLVIRKALLLFSESNTKTTVLQEAS